MDADEIRTLLGDNIFERAKKYRKRIQQSTCTVNADGVRHISAMVQGSGGTSVLAADFRIGRPVHVGQERHFLNPQAVYDDMHMNVAAVVMPVRVGADKGLVAGKMLFTELFPQRLRPVYGQAVVRPVPWVKADDIVVALDVLPFAVLAVPQICPDT